LGTEYSPKFGDVMIKIIIYIITFVSLSAFADDLLVTIEKPLKVIRIGDASQRDTPHPSGVAFILGKGGGLREGASEKDKIWHNKYTAPVSLVVKVKNISKRELLLSQEWNSWGYYNLKLIFFDGFHEYWVTKKKGLWYRNFPAFNKLKSGESFSITVALSPNIWNGIEEVKNGAKFITSIRALYEQHISDFTIGRKKFEGWNGTVSSKYYPANELLPSFKFKKIVSNEEEDLGLRLK
jgi:hypothetical protein